jgi:hypothetical protein
MQWEDQQMGIFDFIFGRKDEQQAEQRSAGPVSFGEGPVQLGGAPARHASPASPPAAGDENERALQRYRYMLRTAPPETIEQAHAEAFQAMTPEQRAYVLQALAAELPAGERAAAERAGSDPHSLARTATRAEMRSPGVMERTLAAHPARGAMGGGMGMLAGTLLASFAAGFAGSMVASAFFDAMGDPMAAAEELAPEELPAEEAFADEGFAAYDGGFEEFL